ncbi:MAG TPA: phage/plasmid primase, P4 family [Pirellulales bacterium]|nr:phage/plasmid primase, P4 family [Pirellulales bacterium]
MSTTTTAETPPRLPKLTEPQLADLRASGLLDETIIKAGIYCETDQGKIAQILNRKRARAKLGACLVLPFFKIDGSNGYYRVKPARPELDAKSKKPKKYESPVGTPNEIYIPPGSQQAIKTAGAALILTEGEKKALAADQDGFPAIGLVGVWGWKQPSHERLNVQMTHIDWRRRPVYIAFDSDLERKPDVADAEARLAHLLTEAGAVVKCLRIPDGPPGEDGKPSKQGLDDYLVAQGKDGLFALLKGAIDPPPVEAGESKESAKELDPFTEVETYLKIGERDGVSRLRFWRGSFWLWRKGWYQELPASEVRAHLVNHVNQFYYKLTTGIVANCLDQLQSQTILPGDTEAPAWLGDGKPPFPAGETLACRNGLLHLRGYLDGEPQHLRSPTPRFFTTCGLDFDFRADAPQPAEWLKFLKSLWPDDPDSIDTLREWFGYCLLTDTSQHKILMLIGPKRSGKGTIARVLRRLVGERNSAAPTLASLGTNFGLQPLIGKTLAVIGDARLGGRADLPQITERLLSVSGEDAQTIDRKGIEATTCTLPVRFVLLSNELPRLNDSSGALASRMILLRLTESFLGREDKGLTDRLLRELPGILLWSIVGWDRLRRRGYFEEPATADDMRREFADLTSPIGAFVRECCLVGPQYESSRDALYAAYQGWCKQAGRQHVDDKPGFGRALHAALPQLKTVKHRNDSGDLKRCYAGLTAKAVLGF